MVAENFDIYALAGGYYPILGAMPNKFEEINKDYGLGSSALNVPAYKTFSNNSTNTKYASIKGNYLSYGATDADRLGQIAEAYEDKIFEALNSQTNPEKITKEAADTLDSEFKESLLTAQGDTNIGLLSEENPIKGRSMEEMFGAIKTTDMNVGSLSVDESEISKNYAVKGISANPPDMMAQGKALDVSRQRLGKRGHSFWGTNLSNLNKDLKLIAEDDKKGLYDTEFEKHNAMMDAGLKHFKARYTGLNEQIKRIKQKYLYTGRRPGTKLMQLGRQNTEKSLGKQVEMGKILKNISATEAGDTARRLATKNAEGQATNYLTDHAINILKHHLKHDGPITEYYVLEPYVHVGYGPITQYAVGTMKEFEYKTNQMVGDLRYELFAGDTELKSEISDFNAMSAAEARFGAHVSKEFTGHGTVMETGKVYKQGVGLMTNNLKIRPSVGVTQADKDFKDVIGKKLLPKLRQIAQGMFVRQGRLFTGMLRDEVRSISDATSFDSIKDHPLKNAWATPYVSVFTFRRQAYGGTPA